MKFLCVCLVGFGTAFRCKNEYYPFWAQLEYVKKHEQVIFSPFFTNFLLLLKNPSEDSDTWLPSAPFNPIGAHVYDVCYSTNYRPQHKTRGGLACLARCGGLLLLEGTYGLAARGSSDRMC